MIELPADGEEKKARRTRGAKVDRVEHDAYMTPPTLVEAIVAKVKALIAPADMPRILEPACGDGEFVAALKSAFPKATVVGVDIREDRRSKIEAMGAKFFGRDFLTLPAAALASVDLVATNPPFDQIHAFLGHCLTSTRPGTTIVFVQRMGHLVGSEEIRAWWRTPLDPANPTSYPIRQLQMRLPLHPRPSFTGSGTDSQEYEIGVYVTGSDNRGIFDPIVWEKPKAKRGRRPAEPQADAPPTGEPDSGGDVFA